MDQFLFTFIPGGGYFLQAANQSIILGCPPEIEGLIHGPSRLCDHVRCLTFGDTEDVWFMNFKDIYGATQFLYRGLPQKLVEWIETPQNQIFRRDHSLRVELGPNGSFFAWDNSTYRWSGLPEKLEETIQDWVRVGGWVEGPPEVVTLGWGNSFYARTNRRSVYVADISCEEQPELYFRWADYERAGIDPRYFEFVCFNMYERSEFVAMDKMGLIDSLVPQALRDYINRNSNPRNTQQDDFGADPHFGPGSGTGRNWGDNSGSRQHRHRHRSNSSRGRHRGESAQDQKYREAEEERKAKQKENCAKAQYVVWKAECDRHFAKGQRMKTFPAPPLDICICQLVSCKNRKIESNLMACVHDVELLLRGSGQYSHAWLKKQMLNWHPDRIGQRSEPEFRAEACRKATEMFAIFQELLSNEKPEK